jgi:hypothetical protein
MKKEFILINKFITLNTLDGTIIANADQQGTTPGIKEG